MTIPRRGAAFLVGSLAALCLLAAACGNDDTGVSAPPTAEAAIVATVEATPMATTPITASPTTAPTAATTSQPTEAPTLEPTPPEPTQAPSATAVPTPDPTPEPTPEPTPTPDLGTAIAVEVAGGKPVGGVQRHRIDVRDPVTITVSGDTADELHIHGYDLVVGFAPGQPGTITFEADIPGIFEVETHHHGDLVMELQVG
ncbi:hypothetical protein [Candidatus Poriferisocius sp.]|uniref:hypothetical protein n=1 Tax=Candidatus Poriferisocius sp. TaxID=3101276 RepID=UPI003B02D51D